MNVCFSVYPQILTDVELDAWLKDEIDYLDSNIPYDDELSSLYDYYSEYGKEARREMNRQYARIHRERINRFIKNKRVMDPEFAERERQSARRRYQKQRSVKCLKVNGIPLKNPQ
jgi:hypothetical protein